jgi:hypothetical protein
MLLVAVGVGLLGIEDEDADHSAFPLRSRTGGA